MFAAIYLPNFYLQAALRHQPELHSEPVGLINGEEAKAILLQVNSAAQNLGVNIGMTPSQGLARSLRLIVKTRSHAQEKTLGELLLHLGGTLAPYLEATAPGICTVEFTDPKNIAAKVTAVIESLAALKITAQGGIAPNPDASLLAAHLARPVLEVPAPRDFLAPLPIETLLLA